MEQSTTEIKQKRIHAVPSGVRAMVEAAFRKGFSIHLGPMSPDTPNLFTGVIKTPNKTVTIMWFRNGSSWRFLNATDEEGNTYSSSEARKIFV